MRGTLLRPPVSCGPGLKMGLVRSGRICGLNRLSAMWCVNNRTDGSNQQDRAHRTTVMCRRSGLSGLLRPQERPDFTSVRDQLHEPPLSPNC